MAASRNGISQSLDSTDDGGSMAADDTLDSTDATSTEEDEAPVPAPAAAAAAAREPAQPLERALPGPVERQASIGPIRGHVEYLQVCVRTFS
jgi:hypothetical protein